MTDVHMTWARVEDAPLVHRLMHAAFAQYAGRLQPPTGSLSETPNDVAEFLRRGGAVIAWAASRPIGTARFEQTDDWLYVGRVSVVPEYRRRGIASAMMAAIENEAAARGLAAVRVGVRMSLADNLALYRKLGYRLVEVVPHPKGEDEVGWLRKELGSVPLSQ